MVSNPKETYEKLSLFGRGPQGIRYIFISYVLLAEGPGFSVEKKY